MSRIFCDSHHQGLTASLKLLFSKRLGYELRFPAGLEWWNEGYWAVFPHISTAQQYLERETEGAMGITLEEFKNTKFDILLCSIPQHVDKWVSLQQLYQPQAKLVFQVGNTWPVDKNFPIKNILAAAKIETPAGFNSCIYHEEFDLAVFNYEPPKKNRKIYSFINCLGAVELYRDDFVLLCELENLMPEWEFKSFGGQCRDGWYNGSHEVAQKMKEADFLFNCKKQGDGYGFTIHEAAAIGRPIITRFADYRGKLAEPLIEDAMTSINVDNLTPGQIAQHIENDYQRIGEMSQNIYQKFKDNVNFEAEEQSIRNFLSNLV